jgi:hypothetical protein
MLSSLAQQGGQVVIKVNNLSYSPSRLSRRSLTASVHQNVQT